MKKQVKIFVIEPNGLGNICHYSTGLSSALSKKGFDVTLVTSKQYEFNNQPNSFKLQKIFERGLFGYVHYLFSLLKLVSGRKPQVVYIQDIVFLPLEILLIAVLKGFFHCRIIFTAHKIIPHEKRFLKLHLYAYLYKLIDIIITHNDYDRRIISDLFQIRNSKIFTVPRGNYLIFEQYFNTSPKAVRQELHIPQNSHTILFFGYISRGKGLDILLKAFRELCDVIPNCKLIIAGKVHNLDYYENLIEDLGIEKDLIVDWNYIPMKQVVKYFAASNVVVLPYRKICESPIVQMAYTFGKPIIKTVNIEDRSFVEGKNGYSVIPGDVIDLTEALIKLFSDQAKLKEMSCNVRSIAKKTYSWENIVSVTKAALVSGIRGQSFPDNCTLSTDGSILSGKFMSERKIIQNAGD